MVRDEFAEKRNEEHLALVAALLKRVNFATRRKIASRSSPPLRDANTSGAPENQLRRSFSGEFDFGHDLSRAVPDFTVFHRYDANEPCGKKAAWVIQHLRDSGLVGQASGLPARGRLDAGPTAFALGKKVFRADIFEAAKTISRKGRERRKGFPENNSLAAFATIA